MTNTPDVSARAGSPPPAAVVGLGVAVCLAVAFLPWSHSGSVTRSGYALLRSARQAGLITGGWSRALVAAAYALPTLAGLIGAALVLRRARLACALTLAGALVLLAGASVVLDQASTARAWGAVAAVPAAAVTAAVALWRLAAPSRRSTA